MLFPLLIKINFENVEGSSTVISKYFDNSVNVVKCLDVATFSHTFHLEMSELISCVKIHTCMNAFICLILCVARSSVVSLQVINMWKYIQSTFVLVPLIQGIQIGFYVWTLVGCIYLIASSPLVATSADSVPSSYLVRILEPIVTTRPFSLPANNLVCIRRINRTTFHMSVTW
jgi:hypothetical protein